MTSSRKRIFLVDACVSLNKGHNYDVLTRFAEFATNSGTNKVTIISNAPLNQVDESIQVYPRKLPDIYSGFREAKAERNSILFEYFERLIWYPLAKYRTSKFWNQFFLLHQLSANDVICLTSSDAINLNQILKKANKFQSAVQVSALMMNVFDRVGWFRRLQSDGLMQKMIKLKKYPEAFLYTETENYMNFLSKKGIRIKGVAYLPIPRSTILRAKSEKKLPSSVPVSQITKIGFIGQPRMDKGFNDYAKIINFLNHTKPNYQYYVHIHPSFVVPSQTHEALKSKNVKILRKDLTISAMRRLISDVDVLILPYVSDVYKDRGSAMLTEAIAALKPVVCPSDLGISGIVRGYHLGSTYNGIWEIEKAIERVVKPKNKSFGFSNYINDSEKIMTEMLGIL